MRRITATSSETVERITEVEVPDHFDPTNTDHMDALDELLLDIECGDMTDGREVSVEESDGRRRVEATLDLDDIASPWTFYGHRGDDNQLVIEYSRPGKHHDDRVDHGFWEGGLWAASGIGVTEAEALAAVRAEYDDGDNT